MRFLAVIIPLMLLNACSSIGAAEFATTAATGKPLSDHVFSAVSGKNCSTIRKNTGQNYCAEDDIPPPPNLYCYRTIGNVTCYEKPDPHKGRYSKVGENSTSLPVEKKRHSIFPF